MVNVGLTASRNRYIFRLVGNLAYLTMVNRSAARVIAVSMKIDGASFLECFQALVDQYHFAKYTAFTITTRVYRGGGLTKDAIYLRGLLQTLKHLGTSGQLETLLIGKIAFAHIGLVKELRWRKVLYEPSLQPRYIHDERALKRLSWVRQGIAIERLVDVCENPSRSSLKID